MPKGIYNGNKGKIISAEIREKISKTMKGKIPKNINVLHKLPRTEEWKRKMSESRLSRKERLGYLNSKETRKKMSYKRFECIKDNLGIAYPVIGKYEKQILDELEIKLGYKIIRQHKVGKFHLDGYIKDINLAIEIDEKYHKNKKEKDLKREEFIKQKLNCEFLRIKNYD